MNPLASLYSGQERSQQVLPKRWYIFPKVDRSVSSKPRPGCLTPGKDPLPIVWKAGWTTQPVWTAAENLAHHRDLIPGPSRRTEYPML